jgi:ribonuclease Z
VLADGRHIVPEMVHGAPAPGTALAVVGDTEDIAGLIEPVRGADALVIEATFLERDATLARARGHLTAAAAARLAREAKVRELLLTHISGRYSPQEILTEAARHFANVRVVADFDRMSVRAQDTPTAPHPDPCPHPNPPPLAGEGRVGATGPRE